MEGAGLHPLRQLSDTVAFLGTVFRLYGVCALKKGTAFLRPGEILLIRAGCARCRASTVSPVCGLLPVTDRINC